jgi:hypothetical protein
MNWHPFGGHGGLLGPNLVTFVLVLQRLNLRLSPVGTSQQPALVRAAAADAAAFIEALPSGATTPGLPNGASGSARCSTPIRSSCWRGAGSWSGPAWGDDSRVDTQGRGARAAIASP